MKKLTLNGRRTLLVAHLLFVAILFGVHVILLTLSLTAAMTNDEAVLKACYTVMHLLANTSVRASTIGTVVSGVLLSMFTTWGLFKYYWVVAKEILTVFAMIIGLYGIYHWTLQGVRIADEYGMLSPDGHSYDSNLVKLIVGIVFQLIFLIAMYLLSVWKPGGKIDRKPRSYRGGTK
ncbi:hypothetical protein D7Z26_06040 [Cohnella endophytica]|uniref:DUF2269 family protein n=1 Tax=Cohnella endophytica TaxID=2419778 RepID=A0A494Y2H6_9BACL|nr:hypothetical protein [Cohnella endophytica]RKP56200.1 hypothetical protein D7Z26_06040 [Cohnella endophytica]